MCAFVTAVLASDQQSRVPSFSSACVPLAQLRYVGCPIAHTRTARVRDALLAREKRDYSLVGWLRLYARSRGCESAVGWWGGGC